MKKHVLHYILAVLLWLGSGHLYLAAQTISWEVITFPTEGDIGVFVVDMVATSEGSLFALLYYGDLYRSDDLGESWEPVPGVSGWAMKHTIADGIIVTGNAGVFASTDEGKTWQQRTANLGQLFVADYERLDDGTMLATVPDFFSDTGGLYRSGDDGASWQKAFDTTRSQSIIQAADGALLVSYNAVDMVVNGDPVEIPGGVHRSTDGGSTWEATSFFAPGLQGVELWLSNQGIIFATGNMQEPFPGRAYRSVDNGNSWATTSMVDRVNGFQDSPDGTIYAAALNSGAYRSTNGGESWESISSGLQDSRVFAMVMHPNGMLFTSDFFATLYRTRQPVVSSVRTNKRSGLTIGDMQPNPARAETRLALRLRQAGAVRLTLFTPHGARIAEVYKADLGSGEHRIPIDTRGLAAGIYLCRVDFGSESASTMLIKR